MSKARKNVSKVAKKAVTAAKKKAVDTLKDEALQQVVKEKAKQVAKEAVVAAVDKIDDASVDDRGFMKKLLCGESSPLGDAAEVVAGQAKSCWCCSLWRGVLVGFVSGVLVAAVITGVYLT